MEPETNGRLCLIFFFLKRNRKMKQNCASDITVNNRSATELATLRQLGKAYGEKPWTTLPEDLGFKFSS